MATPRPVGSLVAASILVVASCGGGSGATEGSEAGAAEATATTQSATTTSTYAAPTTHQPAATEEVTFTSGGYFLSADLVLPGGPAPYPAVVVVSGDGSQTRLSTPGYSLIRRKFGDAGFAVFSWDKPGSGTSTGDFEEGETLRQRAAILADGIGYLQQRPDINGDRIGLWGLSQAGWVMPMALDLVEDVAFMIVVSGGGEDSIEQMGYQIAQQLVCGGLSPEQGDLVDRYGPQAAKGVTYDSYVEAMQILLDIPGMDRFVGPGMSSEADWQPWPAHIDAYFDPMDVMVRTTIPVLAVFGELDTYVDPVQGAAAYAEALQMANNPNYHVELIPDVGHLMQEQITGCPGDVGGATSERYLELLDEWVAMLSQLE